MKTKNDSKHESEILMHYLGEIHSLRYISLKLVYK